MAPATPEPNRKLALALLKIASTSGYAMMLPQMTSIFMDARNVPDTDSTTIISIEKSN